MTTQDPYLWLEDVDGDRSLDWVRSHNAVSEQAIMADPEFDAIRAELLSILQSTDRLVMPTLRGDIVRNYWTDAENPRGVFRTTTWDSYRSAATEWTTLLDVDRLGRDEGASWVWAGVSTRRSDQRRSLIDLSVGGSDTTVTREFDMVDRVFVDEGDGGFVRPPAKGGLTWVDDDTVYVRTDFGDGSLTPSGYPNSIRRWRRGTPMTDAELVHQCGPDDVLVDVDVSSVPGHEHHVFVTLPDFFTRRTWLLRDDELVELDVPLDADASLHGPWIAISLRSDWKRSGTLHRGGSLLVGTIDDFVDDPSSPLHTAFEPTDSRALLGLTWTKHHLVVSVSDHVRTVLEMVTFRDGAIEVAPLAGVPDTWSIEAMAVDAETSDDLWIVGHDFVTPHTLSRLTIGDDSADVIDSTPPFFDAEHLAIEQRFAASDDGTEIPYFVVRDPSVSGPQPTLLAGYGGFQVSRNSTYTPNVGAAWLQRGGTYVVANIRGGGEYGPAWHQAALREKRHKAYEDFEAVARALVADGLTTTSMLATRGGSNGGLLMGNMYVRSPELWAAIVCQVPLLDMARYHHLLAGASWMAEYGDPDVTDDWAFLRQWSPYQLLEPDATYPPILLTTSTRDDRVHPGHARKFAARLDEFGKDVTYWENIEGGHGGAADAGQAATMEALIYTYLWQRVGSRAHLR